MINTSSNFNQESHLEKWNDFDAMTMLQKDAEIEFLRQQVEILKQELNCECQLTQIYSQELKDKEHDLRSIKDTLNTVLKFQKLELNRAKELAKNIAESNTSVSESLAKLLMGIYSLTVKLFDAQAIEVPLDIQVELSNKTFFKVL